MHLTFRSAFLREQEIDNMTERELARRIGEGNAEASEAFAREHYPAVLRLVFRLSGQKEDAEDIAQETFLVARQKISSFRGGSTLRTWIHRIALNEYRQWRRKRRTLPMLDHDQPVNDQGIKAFETGHVLAKAMQNIPEKQREAFVLFEVEQLSMNEVAHVLGVPTGTAKARVAYARQNLRNQLEGRPEVIKDEFKQSPSNG
jgi:RNA polymerase sigma-70 factor (ECF subfamily)